MKSAESYRTHDLASLLLEKAQGRAVRMGRAVPVVAGELSGNLCAKRRVSAGAALSRFSGHQTKVLRVYTPNERRRKIHFHS